jgi:uncharacterized protein YjbI with pentapeptide repeats
LGAHFEQVEFNYVNFTNADLKNATFDDECEFIFSDFTDANLTDAVLAGADLRDTNFTGTNFTGADLTDTNFTGANFTGADLTGANFTGANLTGANLTEAILTDANFTDAIGFFLPSLSPSFKQIPRNQIASDPVEGDVEMINFLTDPENTNYIAFFFQNKYYLVDKTNLSKTIKTDTEIEQQENSIVYKCKTADTMRPENIVFNRPLVKVGAIGLPVNYAYMNIEYFNNVLENTSINVKDRIYEIVETTETVNSVVSFQALHHILREGEEMNELYRSASHCQAGQGGKIYKLRKIKNAGKIVQDAIKLGITKKRRTALKKGGRRKTKKNNSKKSKKIFV